MSNDIPQFKSLNHQLELTMSDDWRANFMAAIFMVEVVKQ
jgi:hypothetical protein